MLEGTKKMKERSGAKEKDIVGKQRTSRVKALTDNRKCTREKERDGDKSEREKAREEERATEDAGEEAR